MCPDLRLLTTYALLLISVASCVPRNQFDSLKSEKQALEKELLDTETSLEEARHEIDQLHQQLKSLKEDSTSLQSAIDERTARLGELEKEHKELEKYYKNLLSNSGRLSRDLAEQQESLMALKNNLDQTRKDNMSLSRDLISREQKVKELEKALSEKDKAVKGLKDRISNALLNFKETDLTVKEKDGKIYVSLAEQLLFQSGSISVDAKGINALQQLAKALQDQKDLDIMVEGHTDNVPISKVSKYMSDNWDLSVMRATSIVKILVDAGVSPKQVTAAGKGEFSPLNENNSPKGRQKNRRTEIIITPDLGKLFKILGGN